MNRCETSPLIPSWRHVFAFCDERDASWLRADAVFQHCRTGNNKQRPVPKYRKPTTGDKIMSLEIGNHTSTSPNIRVVALIPVHAINC